MESQCTFTLLLTPVLVIMTTQKWNIPQTNSLFGYIKSKVTQLTHDGQITWVRNKFLFHPLFLFCHLQVNLIKHLLDKRNSFLFLVCLEFLLFVAFFVFASWLSNKYYMVFFPTLIEMNISLSPLKYSFHLTYNIYLSCDLFQTRVGRLILLF